MQINRAIVTGPTGAVGVALIEELVANSIEVVAVCRRNSNRASQIPNNKLVRVVECNIDQYDQLASLVDTSADAFFYLAWDGTFGATRQNFDLQEANIRYSLDAVQVAHELGCKVFVGAGSQSEYGHIDGVLDPNMACTPDNGYGAAKLSACVMTRALCSELGIRHEWGRIVSLYGPGDGDYTLISQVIDGLLKGEHVSCTPCDQIWDYIYSRDAARAFRLIAECGKDGAVYNLASGVARPLRDFVQAIADNIDGKGSIGFGERPYYPNQVMCLEANIDNLITDINFKPQYSFEDGIKDTIAWRRSILE